MHGAERELAAGANGPELRVFEHLAHRIDAEDSLGVGDQRGDLRRFVGVVLFLLGIEEVLFLEDRMQLAERLEDRGLAAEVEFLVLREQALEHELMRSAAAQTDVGVPVFDDLVVDAVELRGQPRIAERGERIGGDGDFVVLADDDESGHGGRKKDEIGSGLGEPSSANAAPTDATTEANYTASCPGTDATGSMATGGSLAVFQLLR